MGLYKTNDKNLEENCSHFFSYSWSTRLMDQKSLVTNVLNINLNIWIFHTNPNIVKKMLLKNCVVIYNILPPYE